MQKKEKWITIILFLGMIFGFSIWNFLSPQSTFSYNENRELQTFPSFSTEKLFSGEWQKKFEAYLTDQFPVRDSWVSAYVEAERILQKKDVNGVIFAQDEYMVAMDRPDAVDSSVVEKNLNRLEKFVMHFKEREITKSCEEIHTILDKIEEIHGLYSPVTLAVAAALACACFTFLLGGGPIEMLCAFAGAGIGNYIRCKLSKHHYTLFLCIIVSISAACLSYSVMLKLLEICFAVKVEHEAGYICAMLFIIPGFPFITSGIDLAKLDLRSGMERMMYSVIIISVATMTAWVLAMVLGLKPLSFTTMSLGLWQWIVLRICASFGGVFGFSVMFNSPWKLAVAAGIIGAVSNTLRLEMLDITSVPAPVAAFAGAVAAGVLASVLKRMVGYPRISITVPSIVIMVPGLYLYKAVYNLGNMDLSAASSWFASALLIIFALPLGLIFARILTDKTFRYCT